MDGLRTCILSFLSLAIVLGLLAGCAGSTASTPTPLLPPTPAASTPATSKAVQTALPTATATASEPATPTMPAREAGAVSHDVTYCIAGDTELKIDLYAPRAGSSQPAPAVIYVHGGGWVSGDKSASGPIGVVVDELVKRGYFVAAIDYRLAPKHRWSAQIEDVKCAVRHLRENSSTYRLNPDRIGMWGASAGGHLAGLAGLADASAGLEGEGGYPGQSSRVQAVVDMSGPADLTAGDFEGSPEQLFLAVRVFGATVANDPILAQASPVNYISADDPPFLIIHGDRDALVPPSQSQELYDRLVAAGVPATLVIVKNAGHALEPAGGPISPTGEEILKIMVDFFDRYLWSARQEQEGG